MTQATDQQTRNEATSHHLLQIIGRDGWGDLLTDDVVFEFPYAPSIGYPQIVEGKEAGLKYVASIMDMTGGLNMFDIVNMSGADPDLVFNEYKGYYGKSPDNIIPYAALHRYRDGKIAMVREYWDPIRVSGKTPDPVQS